MIAPTVDPRRCPLCANPNACAVAEGETTCWCFKQPVPRDVLAQVPPEARELACVCRLCASRRRDPAEIFAMLKELLHRRG
jgi:hypothetical protein